MSRIHPYRVPANRMVAGDALVQGVPEEEDDDEEERKREEEGEEEDEGEGYSE